MEKIKASGIGSAGETGTLRERKGSYQPRARGNWSPGPEG